MNGARRELVRISGPTTDVRYLPQLKAERSGMYRHQ